MIRWITLRLLALMFAASINGGLAAEDPFQALVRPTDAFSPEEELARLKVPDGFTVQLFAAEPEINKPINLAFDARGRLWVSSTTEYPFAAPTNRWVDSAGSRVRESRDAIKIIEDTDGDGHADKVTDFADGLNIPVGVLPYGRGCIAWSVPNIWHFEDTDGDGMCDRRTVLFGPLGWEKDVHGNIASLRLAPDGWVYATHGFNNSSRIEVQPHRLKGREPGASGTMIEINSGNTFRFRPDGSAVEHWTHGQVNPFGLCLDSYGQFYSADCHSDPITQLLRGAHYPSFGKPHDGLGFAPVMCPHRHGSTGLCGLVHVNRGIWGADWDDTMLLGNVVTSRINRDRVAFTGGTARANEQPDFLVSEDPWFRPVDLQLGPDGALYVADFYNKIIGHYEVDRNHPGRDRTRGRIWRIVKHDAMPPRPLHADEHLAQQWRWGGDATLVRDAQAAAKLLTDSTTDGRLRLAVAETLAFHPQPGNLGPLSQANAAADPADAALRHTLRIALRNQLSLPGEFAKLDATAFPESDLVPVARAVDSPEAALWLLGWLERQPALPADWPETVRRLAERLPASDEERLVTVARRLAASEGGDAAMLRTLRQGFAPRGGGRSDAFQQWAAAEIAALLRRVDELEPLVWTADAAPGRAPGPVPWSVEERACADGRPMRAITSLRAPRGGAVERLTGTLRSREFECPPALTFWLCGHRGVPNTPAHERTFVRLVDSTGVELARAFPPRNDVAREVRWQLGTHRGKPVRLELVDGDDGASYAWLAAGRFEPPVVSAQVALMDAPLLELADLVESFPDPDAAGQLGRWLAKEGLQEETRLRMAGVIGRHPEQADALLAAMNSAPSRLRVRYAEALASTRGGAGRLVDSAPPHVLAAPAVRGKLDAWNDPALSARLAGKLATLPPAAPELDALIARHARQFERRRTEGRLDAEAGARVFAQSCAACHRIGGKGGLVGPQLDGAKQRGAERLCEDILDPNRDVDPAFRTVHLALKNDTVYSGLLRSAEARSLVLVDAAGAEHRLEASSVESRRDSALSLMPSNFGELLPEADFLNLLAWLMTK